MLREKKKRRNKKRENKERRNNIIKRKGNKEIFCNITIGREGYHFIFVSVCSKLIYLFILYIGWLPICLK